jgi:hypothetical protein
MRERARNRVSGWLHRLVRPRRIEDLKGSFICQLQSFFLRGARTVEEMDAPGALFLLENS